MRIPSVFPVSLLLPLSFCASLAHAALGFYPDRFMQGDLDGDGQDDLAQLFWDDPGGSGTFTWLNVITLNENGEPVSRMALVGDRVQVMDARIENGVVTLELIQSGAGESPCCPSQKAIRRWKLEGGKLMELPKEVLGRLSLEDLEGKSWKLVGIGDEAVPEGTGVTLEFSEGKLSGLGGCNRYFATVTQDEEQGGRLSVGLIGSTRKACARPLMQFEQKYFELLRQVSSFSLRGRQLFLVWKRGDESGVLRFVEAAADRQ